MRWQRATGRGRQVEDGRGSRAEAMWGIALAITNEGVTSRHHFQSTEEHSLMVNFAFKVQIGDAATSHCMRAAVPSLSSTT
jgi:hypothetical protein